jgi:RHS repeat-associated protein
MSTTVGLRTRRSVFDGSSTTTTTSTYVYEGLNLLSLSASRSDGATFTLTYLYDSSGRAYAGIYEASDASATAFQMVTTDRGDVVELLDASGSSFAAYGYDEWGVSTLATSSATALASANLAQAISKRQPLRYAGYCVDAEEGLYYLSARTYDPVTRQFLSKDPAKADGEESAYQYCGGDTVGKVDPSGTLATSCSSALAAIGEGPGHEQLASQAGSGRMKVGASWFLFRIETEWFTEDAISCHYHQPRRFSHDQFRNVKVYTTCQIVVRRLSGPRTAFAFWTTKELLTGWNDEGRLVSWLSKMPAVDSKTFKYCWTYRRDWLSGVAVRRGFFDKKAAASTTYGEYRGRWIAR